MSSKILNALELFEIESRYAEEEQVAIMETRLHKGNCNEDSHIIRQGAPDVTKRSEVEVASLA